MAVTIVGDAITPYFAILTLMNVQPETQFFHDIAVMVRQLVTSYDGRASVAKHKDIVGDYATEVDIAVENLIVTEINKRFPGDAILAEEGYSDVAIPDGRIWIIDPICGTSNLGRGLKSFCTNIALANHKELIAACVIDHSQDDYFWSVGNHEFYVKNEHFQHQETDDRLGIMIDLDFGALSKVPDDQKKKFCDALLRLTLEPDYSLQSPNSSLGFAYTAVGKIDGFLTVFNHPWDICAASFLLQQSGGIITDIEGNPWDVSSVGAIGAWDTDVHAKLVAAYTAS